MIGTHHRPDLAVAPGRPVRGVLFDEGLDVVATLLDEGTYLACERTFYRVLSAAEESGERRNQLTHPAYARPELLASAPNELWSWDIERHEAFLNRAVVKGHRHALVAASASKLRAA